MEQRYVELSKKKQGLKWLKQKTIKDEQSWTVIKWVKIFIQELLQ